MTHAERTLVLLLLAACAALVWAWDRQQTRLSAGTTARITELETQAVALSRELAEAEQALIVAQAAREAAEQAQASAEQQTQALLSRVGAVTRASEQALADLTLDADALRAQLAQQVSATQALQVMADSLLHAAVTLRLAAATERASLTAQLRRMEDAVSIRDSLLALQPTSCRVGPVACPSRTTTAILTFIGTTLTFVGIIL